MRIFCAIGFSTAYIDYPENTEAFRAVYREIRGAADFPPLPNPPGTIVCLPLWINVLIVFCDTDYSLPCHKKAGALEL